MPTPPVPLFDAAQLHRRTQGNASLQGELLALFVTEVERLMRQVEDAPDPQLRGDRLRALIGVARNIGAARVAHEARALETQIASESPDAAPLRAAVDETLAFIGRTGG
jgi:HPt (histidine-containing phosphotransfer) domain-containing protein